MSLMDQQWCPTGVQVTVLQARGLRAKGKSGTNDAYAVMQVAKEKYQTSVAEKSVAPVWKEEAAFDLPPTSQGGALHVHVLHRALVGPDKLLGQAVINLLQLSEDKGRNKTEWFKLLDKTGKADKDRGEVLLDIQFMRNNMTASMFDLSAAGKSQSRLSKFKSKVRGKKKESDTVSTVVPSLTQVLTDSEEEGHGDVAAEKDEKKKKHKMKSLFSPKSNLQRNMSQSLSVLPASSSLSGSQSGLNMEASEGKKKFKFKIHKRSGSSVDKDPSSGLQKHSTTEQSNVCINGSHVYCEEPQARTSRIGSNFSLTSSGHGSTEDVRERQCSPCTEEEEDVADVDNIIENMDEEERMRIEDEGILGQEEMEKLADEKTREEEERMRRENEERLGREEEECDTIAEEKRKLEEQERKRIEEKNKQREEEERIKMEEKMAQEKSRQEDEERVRREKMRLEEEERRKAADEKRKEAEELKRREEEKAVEEERIRKEQERQKEEERAKMKLEEERKRIEAEENEQKARLEEENRRKEEEAERIRREKEEREEKRRLEEQERAEEEDRMRKMEQEKIRMEEEKRRQEEEERVREEMRLAEEKRRLEEQERMKEEERMRKMEQERIRMEEEERVREEMRLAEEKRRLEEQERMKEEERMRKMEQEKIRMEEEKRRQEEEERVREEMRLAEEKRRLEEQERMKEEERMRKMEQERIRMEEEERVREEMRLAEEKRRLEEQERMKEEERMRKMEQERIRMEEEERVREEMRLAEEKRRLEEQERVKEEERMRKMEQERIRMEDEGTAGKESEEQSKKDSMSKGRDKTEEERWKVSMDSPTEVTSTNPFDESHSPSEENPNSSDGLDSSTVSNGQERCQSAVPSVRIRTISSDEKHLISAQREKRPAPQPPGRSQAERPCQREADASTRHLAQTNKQSDDRDIKTASVLPQRWVQMIAPVSRTPIDANPPQSLVQSSAPKGAAHSKGPAPPRPRSVDEEPSRPTTASPSVGNVSPSGSEAKRVYGLNPFDDDEDENEPPVDAAASGDTHTICWPPQTDSQTKVKSSKVARAPPPPAGVTTASTSATQAQKSPVTERKEKKTQEGASAKKDVPPTALRRLQPVKPLNPQSIPGIQGEQDNKATGILKIQDKHVHSQVNGTELKGPFSQLTQDELISLVLKQEKQLSERDHKISQLEQYIDNLLVRVMEEKPSILMSLSCMRKAV